MTKPAKNEKPAVHGLHFAKMTGTGNDFLIFDARGADFPEFDRPLFVKSVCRRTLSVGADGVVFIEKTKTPHTAFKWDFYNSDGSHAEMCGNAARCAARFAVENEIADKNMTFETAAGPVGARVRSGGHVEVDMPSVRVLSKDVEVPLGEHLKIHVTYLNTGVPHVVKENEDWNDEYLHEVGRYLRTHELFKPSNGANVTFYEKVGESVIHSATYERGVEGVTMACGTGAVAAAATAVLAGMKSPVEVRVPGGTLFVSFSAQLEKPTLAGEARLICEGELKPEALL